MGEESTMVAVTQATSCCRVVMVMRKGSVDIDRLNDTGTYRRREMGRERGEKPHKYFEEEKVGSCREWKKKRCKLTEAS